MIHLIVGKSAEACLKFGLDSGNHKVIGFPVNFSVGPIKNIHGRSGMENYFTWLEMSLDEAWSGAENDQSLYTEALAQLNKIDDGAEVTIWTCENASEQVGLRLFCYLLKEKALKLNLINTYTAMKKYKNNIMIRHSGECSSEDLAYFFKHDCSPISNDLREELTREAEVLSQSEGYLRSWRNGKIIGELETKHDAFIMMCAKRLQSELEDAEYMPVARLIGEVIGHAQQPLSDAWIEYRIRMLIDAGYLVRKGNMKMYQIKVVK